ncbi:MAG: DUF4124 domain-containing protein [Rhodocyclaceae bacterium]|nr:DUF4124 domain-containing protein [Rhodocyclaceae bacterium]MBR4737600.1 DUF4124 domain-containing protein [Rhodocyclaceae bacterium]
MKRIFTFLLIALSLLALIAGIFVLQSDRKIVINMSSLMRAFKDMGSAVSVEPPPAQTSAQEAEARRVAAALSSAAAKPQPQPAPASVYKCTTANGRTTYTSDGEGNPNCQQVSEKLSVVPHYHAPRNTAAPTTNTPRKPAQPQGIQSTKKTLTAQEESKTQRCDDLLERMENIDQQARQRSTQYLRDRKKRLQEEHRRLGCSHFHSSRH